MGALSNSINKRATVNSQFPFWDFVQCNVIWLYTSLTLSVWACSLNSLSGISSNATEGIGRCFRKRIRRPSQFPFWDFVECNIKRRNRIQQHLDWKLSIPFLGFRWMQLEAGFWWDSFLETDSQFPLWDFVECNRT